MTAPEQPRPSMDALGSTIVSYHSAKRGSSTLVCLCCVSSGIASVTTRDKVFDAVVVSHHIQMINVNCAPRERLATPVAKKRLVSVGLIVNVAMLSDVILAISKRMAFGVP